MAEPRKIVQGGLKAFEAASKAVDAEEAAGKLSTARNAIREADKAMEAKRLAMEAANPPIKASEAYGQHEGAYLKPIFYDRMKVDLSQGKKGGPGFSSIQLVDPNYANAKAVAGVTDQKMATRILNRNKAGVPAGAKVIWTPSVGGLEQHKSNSTMFGQFADIFANERKNMTPEEIQKLSDRASNAVDNKGKLIFPNGIDLSSRNFRQKVTTYDQRALMADIFAGRGVGGEKGRTVPVEELLEKNLDPNVASAGTLDLGNRLFRLEGNVIDRPDLHTDYRKILTGEDLGVNYIPVPIRDVYADWEVQKALDLAAQGKNRGVTLMDYTKNDPTIQLTEELLTRMQKAGYKKGGAVHREESPEDMAEFQKRFALHKATGGSVNIPRLSLKKAGGGGVDEAAFIEEQPAIRSVRSANKARMDGADIENAMLGLGVGDATIGVNLTNRKRGDEPSQMSKALVAAYNKQFGDTGVNASLIKPENSPPGFYAGNLGASHQIGGGNAFIGTNLIRTPDGKVVRVGDSIGYSGKVGPGHLSASMMQGRDGQRNRSANIQYQIPFADGGGVHMVDGGKIGKGLMGAVNKAAKAVDAEAAGAKALTSAEREANKAKFLEPSAVKERLYHGTKGDIKSFDLSKRGSSDLSSVGGGVYLTQNPNVASLYAKLVPGESGANVMPVHAQVKNPYEFDRVTPFKSQAEANEFSRRLQEAGYDSIIKRGPDNEITELVVFEPNKIKSAIGNRGTYDVTNPDIDKAKGGAVGHESIEELEHFHKRFALHKATGGKINIPHLSLKRVKKFDGGGMAVQSPEETVTPQGDIEKSRGAKIAEKLYEMAKEQGKEEVASLKKPRAITDLLNRGVLANNPVSAGVDLLNMGLGAVGLGSEKPFLGSEHIKDLMDKYGVTSGEERPLMETALSFASPAGMIRGAQKTVDVAKKAPEVVKRATDAFTSSKLSPLATEAKTASAGKPTGATYATKQEGPFFRVRPTSPDASAAKGRGVREADELQGTTTLGGEAGSTGSPVPTRLSDEEVARIIADPAANEPLNIAKRYTQETQGSEFTLPQIPESSLVKQSAIGRTHQLAVEGTPEYKSAVFDAYAREMPEVLEQSGAKNYDDLMEKAYRQLAKETDDQFRALPYNFSYHRAGEGNYNSSKEMAADVHGNKHLYVFQGGDPHDFLNRIDPATGLNENEKFRAVHDLLGHAIYGNQFGPKGEETAWAIHSQMYSPLARLAMTSETRGQNSMVNYSPLNAALKAEIAKYDDLANEARRRGDKALLNEINAAKRQAYSGFQYAPQKAVLLPPEFLSPQYAGGMPSYLEAANRPVKGTETQSVLTHFSHNPELQFVDPTRYGTGIKGAEAERLRDFPGGVRDRSYFYMGEPGAVSPEPGLGVNRYRGEASSLYDITQDPLNFRVLARESNRVPYTAKYNQGITSPLQEANDMERLVKEYGYQGMANPKASKPMAIMFKETPVRRQARGGLTLMK